MSTNGDRASLMCIGIAAMLMMPTTLLAKENFPGLSPQADDDAVRASYKEPSYSPYAGRNFPTKVFWGDTHVHTDNSLDAQRFGVKLDAEVPVTIQERAYTSPIWYTP